MAKKTYTVLTAVEHNGKRVEAGAPITLDEEFAQALLDVRAIETPAADGKDAKAEK